jgi:glycerophosphoryl diester phosphodiesterase
MLEMDVCETKDGHLVVHHDHDLERTCGKKAFIRDLNLNELPKFREEIELNFAPEGMTVRSRGESIPTLD